MSNLTYVEKSKFEKLLGMESGYVLDFTNRSFAEFVRDSTGQDIYDSRYDYGSGSKANRLRAFWQKEENGVVGKLMGDMLDYSGATGPPQEVCRLIVARLLQNSPVPRADTGSQDAAQSSQQQRRSQELRQLREDFFQLASERDRNRAGLALEKLLNRLFEIFELRPRQPFRVVGEQIDGSFELEGQVYLLESKWENTPLPEADLAYNCVPCLNSAIFPIGFTLVPLLRKASRSANSKSPAVVPLERILSEEIVRLVSPLLETM